MRLHHRTGVLFANTPALVTFGDRNIGTVDDTLSANAKVVGPAVAPSSGNVTKMTGYLSGQGSGTGDQQVRAVIYANSAGAPGALVGASDTVTITDGSAYAWHDFPFSSPPAVAAGVTYWIGYHGGTPQDGSQIKSVSGSGLKYQDPGGDTFADGSANPFGTVSGTLTTIAHQSLYVTVGQVTPPAPFVLPRYGIATGFPILTRTDAGIAFELDECAAVGAKYIRVDSLNQPSWQTALGKVIAGAEARGLKVAICLRGTSAPIGASGAASFATQQINTWGNRVAEWSWVNEPNLPTGAARYTPTQYATELAAVYDALKAVNSNCVVGAGVLGWQVAGDFSTFWSGVLSNGGSGKFDLVDVHCYGAPSTAPWTEAFGLDSEGKPVLITEAGSNSTNATTRANVVSQAMQDGRAVSICIYSMMNASDNYGLLDSSNVRRPAWYAYQAVATA